MRDAVLFREAHGGCHEATMPQFALRFSVLKDALSFDLRGHLNLPLRFGLNLARTMTGHEPSGLLNTTMCCIHVRVQSHAGHSNKSTDLRLCSVHLIVCV